MAQFEELLRWRRDVRHFQSCPVPETVMHDLLRSASLAPSVGNSQPWRFVRLRSPAIRETLAVHVDEQNARAAKRYTSRKQRDLYLSLKLHGIREAPEIIAVFCEEQPEAGQGLGIATMPEALRYSVVMAIHNMWLAARIRDVGIGWVSILEPRVITELLQVPARWSFVALLCVGYPLEASNTPELEVRGWQAVEPWTDRVFER